MTLRAKPVVKRRSPMDSNSRRNLVTNIGFGLVIAAAIAILVAAGVVTWYNDHLAAVGTVNGRPITVDELRERAAIERFRVDYAASRINTELAAGRLTEAEAAQQLAQIDQRRQQLGILSLERLIDVIILEELATAEQISATEAEIDARLLEEKTVPPTRHAWVIEVAPAVDPGATDPTPEQIADARVKVAAALAELRAGRPWEDVARATSTAASAPQAGDVGWIIEEGSGLGAELATAIFAAELNVPSEVIEGDDGAFYIVRVTEFDPGSVDITYEARLEDANVTLEQYRAAVRIDVVRKNLEDKIVAEALKPGPQRRIAEVYLRAESTPPKAEAIKVRHILYSPKDDPGGAGDLPDDDPAWEAARVEAQATYDKLVADPGQFDAIARAESDETSARQTGGKLPYFDAESAVDPDFLKAITASGLEPGDLIRPFKSAFGYHVVQVMRRPPDIDWARDLKTKLDAGADFTTIARDNSDGAEAAEGGVVGWIAKGELDELSEKAIFGTEIGRTSDPVEISGLGIYLFRVLAEDVRELTPSQEAQIRSSAYTDWYQAKKATYEITRDQAVVTRIG